MVTSKLAFTAALMAAVLMNSGCAPAVVGGAAVGGYAVGSDERTSEQISEDIRLSGAINKRLAEDDLLGSMSIDVDVVEGYATLSGVLKTAEQAQRAVELAKSVEGVRGVRNNLQIGERSFSGVASDSWISSQVKTKLVAEPGIKSLNIDVDVYQGIVTLTGLVGDSSQKTRAMELAAEVEGVIKVVDNLKIKTP